MTLFFIAEVGSGNYQKETVLLLLLLYRALCWPLMGQQYRGEFINGIH